MMGSKGNPCYESTPVFAILLKIDYWEVFSMSQFELCSTFASLMKDFNKPWGIAGGWAIDLFIGSITRKHEDIEIAIFREDQCCIQKYLAGWNFKKVKQGKIEPWGNGERLELPVHETYAERDDQKIEILLNELDGEDWVFRRDNRIRRPVTQIFMKSPENIPYLSPEIVLLYKSKNPRSKDEIDFHNTIELLDSDRKQWLKDTLKTIYEEHPWIRKF